MDVGCYSKETFQTFTHARKVADKMRRKKEEIVEPYRCRSCSKFHVGHPGRPGRVLVRGRRDVGRLARRVGAGAGAEEGY